MIPKRKTTSEKFLLGNSVVTCADGCVFSSTSSCIFSSVYDSKSSQVSWVLWWLYLTGINVIACQTTHLYKGPIRLDYQHGQGCPLHFQFQNVYSPPPPSHNFWLVHLRTYSTSILSRPTLVKFLYQSVLTKRKVTNPVGWRLQPMHGPCTFGSPPPMSSRHRNSEPLGRWHQTIYISQGFVGHKQPFKL